MNNEVCPLPKLGKMLLATDCSDFSEGAIREAITLAKLCSSKLRALSVVETAPEYETIATQFVNKKSEQTMMHLKSIKERAAKEGVDCEIVLRQCEEPYRCIVDEAQKNDIDVIVMGRRGRTGLQRLMMGSVTSKVIGHTQCNVLVIPRAATVRFKNILAATDGSKYSDSAIREAVSIAKQHGSELTFLAVVPSGSISPLDIVHAQMQRHLITDEEHKVAETVVKSVKDFAAKKGVSARGLILEGTPYQEIVDTADKKKMDLIVIGSRGKSGVEKLLMGSVTERVIVLSPCALLVITNNVGAH